MKFNNLPQWKVDVLTSSVGVLDDFEFVDNILVCRPNMQDEQNTIWQNSIFAQRALVPYTTTWCEQRIGESVVDKILGKIELANDQLVLDAGCGDGRYVKYFLNKGFSKIIGFNFEYLPLLELSKTLSAEELDRVFLVCGDIFNAPFRQDFADFVLAWGLFTSTSNFQISLNICIDLLKNNAYMLNAEPTLEHALIYSLVMNDLKEFKQISRTGTRSRMWDTKESRYKVYSVKELEHLMENEKINRIENYGINILPSLIFGGMLADKDINIEEKESLWASIQNFDCSWDRQTAFFSKKV